MPFGLVLYSSVLSRQSLTFGTVWLKVGVTLLYLSTSSFSESLWA